MVRIKSWGLNNDFEIFHHQSSSSLKTHTNEHSMFLFPPFASFSSYRNRERTRVVCNNVFEHQPMITGEFQAVQKYIMDHGAHVWSSERKNKLYIKYDHVERVQKFVQKWRAKAAAARR